jgi:hypothetical protein
MILLFIAIIGSEAKLEEGKGNDSEELEDEVGEETAIVVVRGALSLFLYTQSLVQSLVFLILPITSFLSTLLGGF